jgi:hypothetical protein
MSDEEDEIGGISAPGPRFTRWALLYFLMHIALPVMTIALLLDIVTWQIAEMTGGRCYAFVCLWL